MSLSKGTILVMGLRDWTCLRGRHSAIAQAPSKDVISKLDNNRAFCR